jgi:hypothetical protein
MYICRQNGEKSVSIDALACYFALYRKDVGNLLWNSSINEQKGKATDVVFRLTVQLCTRLWRGAFLYVRQGFHFRRLPLR